MFFSMVEFLKVFFGFGPILGGSGSPGPSKKSIKIDQDGQKIDFKMRFGHVCFRRWVWRGFWKGFRRNFDGILGFSGCGNIDFGGNVGFSGLGNFDSDGFLGFRGNEILILMEFWVFGVRKF